jgi:hypothetical protein
VPSSLRTVKFAHGPEILFTLTLHVNTLGVVQVVNLHRVPGTKPSGNDGAVFVINTGNGELVPICAVDWAGGWVTCETRTDTSSTASKRAAAGWQRASGVMQLI